MANSIERQGIGHCQKVASMNKWMFREQPIDDIGIDAHLEIVDETGKIKQLLALQIKSGTSWFKERKEDNFIFRRINERQYNYWTTNSLPCIIVLYNPENDICIWQVLTQDTIKRTKEGDGKGYFVEIPINHIFLDSESHSKLLDITNLPEHITNYNFLLSQKNYMQLIQSGANIKLHATEWIHKSSGRGTTELVVENDGSIERFEYPYWFPYTPYKMVFPRLFPWADFTADENFFEEIDDTIWKELHCFYDKEDDEWLVVGDTFEEYRRKLSPMRSLTHSGEVAEYMMELNINDLGRAFLKVDEFVSMKRPYVKVRPKK